MYTVRQDGLAFCEDRVLNSHGGELFNVPDVVDGTLVGDNVVFCLVTWVLTKNTGWWQRSVLLCDDHLDDAMGWLGAGWGRL